MEGPYNVVEVRSINRLCTCVMSLKDDRTALGPVSRINGQAGGYLPIEVTTVL